MSEIRESAGKVFFYSFKWLLYRRESILDIAVFPRQKIMKYIEFDVLLACDNVGNFLVSK